MSIATLAPGTLAPAPWPSKHAIFDVGVSATDYDRLAEQVLTAADRREGGAVTHMAVHALVTAALDRQYRQQISTFDVVAPDGQPVRWALNAFAKAGLSDRVYGPEFMFRLCRRAAERGTGIYLYGSTSEVVTKLRDNLVARLPGLRVVGCEPSIFRPLTAGEDRELVQRINDSGAGLLFVGLGCPRQEVFAFEHRQALKPVQICVGAAFDFHAGNKAVAPAWMQRMGMEWLFRLASEPSRLWRRYLFTNSVFCLLVLRRIVLGR